MPTLLRMPEVSANATHAVLAAWTVNENDAVEAGACLAEIESDKAVVELEAEHGGTLARQLVQAGAQIEVGAIVGVLTREGETAADVDALLAARAPAKTPVAAARQEPAAATPAARIDGSTNGRLFASPVARRLAETRGIDLRTVRGSGPNGRVVKRDVEAATAAAGTGAASTVSIASIASTAAIAVALPPPADMLRLPTTGFVEVPHSGMRRTIARRLTESKATIPHFYLQVDCRMDRLLALRTEINAFGPRKISVNDFVVRAAAAALKAVPAVNVSWTETAMRQFDHADIAVAVATESGLVTPIVRAAESKSVTAISAEVADLVARARNGKLRPDEYQGGSFSISNLGMYGISEFSAIINPPHAAILAVGATQALPVASGDQVTVAQVMRCTLSVDHRAIDGAAAAQWLGAFKRVVENPVLMLV